MLFCCFMSSGAALDAYYTWYSFHFASECAESGYSVPGTFILFTGLSLVPALVSITLGNHVIYRVLCLGAWGVYCYPCAMIVWGEQNRLNCYRDIGGATVASLAFTAMFAAAIVAITLAFGLGLLARRVFRERSL